MFQAIREAMATILRQDSTAIVFGEDVAFGGVFRCTMGLRDEYGEKRVFNTPLCEQGIAGFAAGYSAAGGTAIAEIQFLDYILPAFDQISNEIAKFRYRSGGQFDLGGLVIRAPCGAVGHGGLYHSQSTEAYFTHTPGLVVTMPRSPYQAKGLLIAAAKSKDPVIFLEPKALYRAITEPVPVEEYILPIGKAEIITPGTDCTVLGYGSQLYRLQKMVEKAAKEGISCELIDLRTLLPWDVETVCSSVEKTGRLLVSHEAPLTSGFAAEVTAVVQDRCALHLKAPIERVCGWDTPFPLVYEHFYLPNEYRCWMSLQKLMQY